MSKNLRGNFKWMAIAGASLLGACGAPGDENPVNGDGLAQGARELAARDVSVRLSADKATFGAGEKATVTVTLTNDSRHAVKLLKWYTPAEGLEEELLQVKLNGEDVEFTGPHYKRPAASEKDFLTLAPGESLTRTVDLGEVYDLSRTGSYTLRFEVETQKLHGNSAKAGLLESNDVNVWIEGRASARPADDVTSLTGSISFSGRCTTTQQATIMDALNAASAMADNSMAYLNGTPSGTPRYTTWFGAFSSGGWTTAQTHFAAIKDAFDTRPITVDCGCKKSYYAYVYPNQPYTIYVCNAFWTAPMTGTDSKGGTLIHEMSHFTVVAGTDDHVYGQTGCKSLALSNPTDALNNADSHEYFAENTPLLQ
ncbi:M35 family metallo-endopeptidase [Archangium sp.]|uniref:M35 family metallo-endopeptidase n=1 Tax=Archangium sp. TaxID=1872627 RepID=UPI002D63E730|nr:M35 family metallo-endopeptidase [Archangium sp.]HYO60114.1 M35 family metallo-endopeptidase [Archangium sp.]